MARPATEQLGIIGILREVLAVPLRNPGLMASVLLLLLLPCNFLFTFPELSPPLAALNVGPLVNLVHQRPQEHSLGESPGVAEPGGPPAEVPRFKDVPIKIMPLNSAVAELTALAMVYLSAVACKGKHATLGELWSKIRRSWKNVAVSSLYVQLFRFTYGCLFLLLAAVMGAFNLPTSVFLLLLLALFSMVFFTTVFSLYLGVICRLCLVVSAVEEDMSGVAALAKAFDLTRRRKLQGFVLVVLCVVLSRFAAWSYAMVGGGDKQTGEIASLVVVVWRFAGVLVDLSRELLGWFLWTVYYYECNKSHGSMAKEDVRDEGRSLLPMSCSVDDQLI